MLPAVLHPEIKVKRKVEVAGIPLEIEDEEHSQTLELKQREYQKKAAEFEQSLKDSGIPVQGTAPYNKEFFTKEHYTFGTLSEGNILAHVKNVYGSSSKESRFRKEMDIAPSWWIVGLIGAIGLLFKGAIDAAGVPSTIVYDKEGSASSVDPGLSAWYPCFLSLVAFALVWYMLH